AIEPPELEDLIRLQPTDAATCRRHELTEPCPSRAPILDETVDRHGRERTMTPWRSNSAGSKLRPWTMSCCRTTSPDAAIAGSPARFTAVLIRNLARVVDFLPSFYGLGLLIVIVSPRSQRLGDLAAGTYVVRAPKPQLDYFSLRTTTRLGEGKTVPTRALSGEMQRLVREFASREGNLAPKDRMRIARPLAARIRPYALDVSTVTDDVEFLRAVARSLRASGG